MDESYLFPFSDEASWLIQYCKLPLHIGAGSVEQHGTPDSTHELQIRRMRQLMGKTENDDSAREFSASFLVPATGNCLIFLQWPGECELNKNFGKGLTVNGDSTDGPFRLTCPQYYVKIASLRREKPGWAVARPTNEPAVVSYGKPRPVASVSAIINNFDFEYGNQDEVDGAENNKMLRVEAGTRTVDFNWRAGREQLRRLVDAGIIGTTSFVTFSFAAWPGASDEELISFADHVSTLCSYVVGQHTGIPVLSFLDADGVVVRRTLRAAIQSKCRDRCALRVLHAESGLPRLFRRCFDQHCRMQLSELWRRLPALFAAIEDPPYLEQKYATLMMSVELLIRSTLIEGRYLTRDSAEAKTLPELIGLARGQLRWEIPKHYTEGERYRLTRNAVNHGNSLPHPIDLISADFNKWKLFW